MHSEALDVLPKLLDAIGFRRGLLVGHSDGASIAAIYAGAHQDHRVQGLALIAPHFIVEDISVTSIAEIKTAYETTDLKAKLARWHKDVDNAFYGWNGAWLDPEFRDWDISEYLAYIRVPGRDPAGRGRPVWDHAAGRDRAGRVLLSGRRDRGPGAGHSPHREAPGATLDAISDFANAAPLRDDERLAGTGRVTLFVRRLSDEHAAARCRPSAAAVGPTCPASGWRIERRSRYALEGQVAGARALPATTCRRAIRRCATASRSTTAAISGKRRRCWRRCGPRLPGGRERILLRACILIANANLRLRVRQAACRRAPVRRSAGRSWTR